MRLTTSFWKNDNVEKPKGSQGQTQRAVVLKEDEEEEKKNYYYSIVALPIVAHSNKFR